MDVDFLASLDFLFLILVIFFFTIIQSIFGVGLLVFGTPTLLLMGYSFPETLSYLLPASIVVSFLQVYNAWDNVRLYRTNVILFMLPPVGLGLLLILFILDLSLYLVVGSMLLLTSLARSSSSLNKSLEYYLSRNFKFGFFITGFIHGLTNLGGAPLVIITNGIYNTKKRIQVNVAYAYLFMAIIQVFTLILVGKYVFSYNILLFPIISGIIYLSLGNFVFNFTSEKLYFNLMTSFIFIYGLLLIFKSI